jgi:hypothetical protein
MKGWYRIMSSNKRIVIDEEYFSFEKFLWTLLNEARLHKLPMEITGFEISNRTGINYPLYRLVIHPMFELTAFIVPRIHGNEIADHALF